MAVSGHVCEDKTILSFSASPVLSQVGTALVFETVRLRSQEAAARYIGPQLRNALSLLA